jgi:glycosyltransferase involved in cell wall biosynthesis
MRIVVLVESLTFGGAERQACVLAGEFKRRGHQVCVATYHRDDFYRSLLERENVEHRFLGGRGKVSWAVNVRRFLRTHGQDVVLAFLAGPSAYAELAGIPTRSWGLVVCERSTGVVNRSWFKTYLHTFANYVTVNSHAARLAMGKDHPQLRPKLVTIYNAVRIEPFGPPRGDSARTEVIRLIVPARVDRNKNAQGLLLALHKLHAAQPSLRLHVDWYGDQEEEPGVVREAQKGITELGLEGVFRLHPPADSIHSLMSQADAVVLPSFYEGLPNAVCEGMTLGRPILMSAVCDAGNLVKEGVNGFLFDPHSPESIADAIARFVRLTSADRDRMGNASRARAEKLFDVNTIVDRYLCILEAAAQDETTTLEHWPKEIPDAAGIRPLRQSARDEGRPHILRSEGRVAK